MADKVTSTRELKIVAQFTDGDDRTIAIPNPKATVTKEQIQAIATAADGVLIGDKADAPFQKVKTAKIVEATNVKLDLTTP